MPIDIDILNELKANIKEGLAEFSAKLTPNSGTVLGVSVKDIRIIAKKYQGDYEQILALPENSILEISLLKCCVLGYASCDIQKKCDYIHSLAAKFTNWQQTDILASSIKIKNNEKEQLWDAAKALASTQKEFVVRQGLVLILARLIDDYYLPKIFEILNTVKYGDYYVDMAAAWLLSICFVKFPKETLEYLFNKNNLNKFTYNKAIQKMIESSRVSNEDKKYLKTMKKS